MVREGFLRMFKADSKDEQELTISGWWGWEEPFRQEEEYFQKLQADKTWHVKEIK